MKEIKCPVCGKIGIEDYHNKDIKCPCCGSDLSIFRVIDKIPNNRKQKTSIWKIISCVFFISILFIAFNSIKKTNVIQETKSELTIMQDSIFTLNANVKVLKEKLVQNKKVEVYYKHIVRSGDNLWKISYKYFNTGNRYIDIAKWNNIDVNTTISVGDTLIIR